MCLLCNAEGACEEDPDCGAGATGERGVVGADVQAHAMPEPAHGEGMDTAH